jgi:hypothetical protein
MIETTHSDPKFLELVNRENGRRAHVQLIHEQWTVWIDNSLVMSYISKGDAVQDALERLEKP